MASPTAPSGVNQPDPSWQTQSKQMPLLVRRCGVWAVGNFVNCRQRPVPFSIGALVNNESQPCRSIPP